MVVDVACCNIFFFPGDVFGLDVRFRFDVESSSGSENDSGRWSLGLGISTQRFRALWVFHCFHVFSRA